MWYHANWQYRKKVTIQSSKIDSNLSDFPVYVDLSALGTDFFTAVQNGGGDIRVTKADGTTEVAREVVTCDTAEETGELHFKADGTLLAAADTDFYIYYGNSGASDYATDATYGAEAVWSEYDFVSHDGNATDSTGNTSGWSTAGTPNITTGKVGRATNYAQTSLGGIATEYYYNSALVLGSKKDHTISAFVRPDETAVMVVFSERSGTPIHSFQYFTATGYAGYYRDDANTAIIPSYNASYSGEWSHQAISFNEGATDEAKLYVNSVLRDTKTGALGATTATGMRATIGSYWNASSSVYSAGFDGLIDELRVACCVRSIDWISAEYENQNAPASFYTVGTQEENAVALTAQDVTFGTPVISSPTLGQVHALTAQDITMGTPVISSPTLVQVHMLTVADVVTGTPVISSPTLSENEGQDVLTAQDVVLGAPTISEPTLGQVHMLTVDDVVTEPVSIESPSLVQVHMLTVGDVVMGAVTISSPTLSENVVGERTLTDQDRADIQAIVTVAINSAVAAAVWSDIETRGAGTKDFILRSAAKKAGIAANK